MPMPLEKKKKVVTEKELDNKIKTAGNKIVARQKQAADKKVAAIKQKQESKKAPAKPKLSKFGSAFAAARKAGKSTFEWNGKKYTTEMKGEKKKAGQSKPNQSKAPSPQKKAAAPKGPTKAPVVKGVFKKKGPDAKALAAKRKARGDLK